MKDLLKKTGRVLIASLVFIFTFSLISPVLADVGMTVKTPITGAGENVIYGNASNGSGGNSLLLLQTQFVDKFKVDRSGNTTAAGTINGQGGLCINGDCKGSWAAASGSQWTTSGNDIYYNTGNVGIGTAGPGYKLDVNGGISINGKSLVTANGYFISGTSGFRWNNSTDAYNNVIMYDNGNMYVRGSVGIGNAPASTLTVKGVDNGWNSGLGLITNNGAITMKIHPDTDTNYGLMFNSGGSGYYFDSGYTRFIDSVSIGVGAGTPGAKLQVNGTANINGYGYFNGESLSSSLRTGGIYGDLGLYVGSTYNMQFDLGSPSQNFEFTQGNNVRARIVGADGSASFSGTVSAPQFVGGGAGLTGIVASNSNKLGGLPAGAFLSADAQSPSGNAEMAASNNGSTSYSVAGLELRESNYGGNSGYLPPRLAFHWGGVVASQLTIESDGKIAVVNNPGTGYENFRANDYYLNNRGLWLSDALNQTVRTDSSPRFSNLYISNGGTNRLDAYNNNGYFAMNNDSTYWGLMGNYSANDWRLGYGSPTSLTGWSLRWDNGGNAWVNGELGVGGSVNASGGINGSYGSVSGDMWAGQYYTGGWYRNSTDNTGLYNSAARNHWYSDGTYWKAGNNNSGAGGIQLRYGYEGDLKGYVYWDGSGFGLLSSDGNWRLRTQPGYQQLYGDTYMATNYMSGNLYINNTSPTIFMQDSDNRSAMLHTNSNVFYVLRGCGTNSTGWCTVNGYWPLEINLETNNATFGGTIYSPGLITADGGVRGNGSASFSSGVYGYSSGNSGYGVYGYETGPGGTGVRSWGTSYNFYGANPSAYNYFPGNTNIGGGGVFDAALVVYSGSTWGRYSASGWTHTSDARLKENVVGIDNALSKIKALNGVYFNWKSDDKKQKQIGFIAQEVLPIIPEAVQKNSDGYYSLAYDDIIPVLTNAIKEQQNQIEELKNQNENLNARLQKIEQTIK